MTSATDLLTENQSKLAAKAKRLRTQLVAVELELAEVETALKVLNRYGLSPTVEPTIPEEVEGTQPKSAAVVYGHLPFSPETGSSPKEVHDAIIASGIVGVSADNVRTILWRMERRSQIRGRDGRYWRYDADEATDQSETGDTTLAGKMRSLTTSLAKIIESEEASASTH